MANPLDIPCRFTSMNHSLWQSRRGRAAVVFEQELVDGLMATPRWNDDLWYEILWKMVR